MHIKHLKDCVEFTAGDGSRLREILNPLNQELKINYSLAWALVEPGEKTVPHRLKHSEVYYILRGVGVMHINNEKKEVGQDDTVYIPPGSVQYIENRGEKKLEFLCIVDPAWKPEIEEVLSGTGSQ